MAAAQEQDRQNRLEFEEWAKRMLDDHSRLMQGQNLLMQDQNRLTNDHKRLIDDQKNLMGRLAQISNRQTELLDHQSQRMDRLDKLHADWLVRNEDFQKQTLHLLNLILDRLPPKVIN